MTFILLFKTFHLEKLRQNLRIPPATIFSSAEYQLTTRLLFYRCFTHDDVNFCTVGWLPLQTAQCAKTCAQFERESDFRKCSAAHESRLNGLLFNNFSKKKVFHTVRRHENAKMMIVCRWAGTILSSLETTYPLNGPRPKLSTKIATHRANNGIRTLINIR